MLVVSQNAKARRWAATAVVRRQGAEQAFTVLVVKEGRVSHKHTTMRSIVWSIQYMRMQRRHNPCKGASCHRYLTRQIVT